MSDHDTMREMREELSVACRVIVEQQRELEELRTALRRALVKLEALGANDNCVS